MTMPTRLVYYNSNLVNNTNNLHYPGIFNFSQIFKVFNPTVMLIDRTSTIKFPVHAESLFPIPKPRTINDTFEQLCDKRAIELLTRAEQQSNRIYVFWSGGIDSTLVVVSLLKNATIDQVKNITVLLSEESISEYPKFYEEHIHGKLTVDSAMMFPYLLGGKHLIINGEHNDQLFGSDVVSKLIVKFGPSVIHQKYQRDMLFSFFDDRIKNRGITNLYIDIFEKLKDAAPVPITTHYEYLWWINFSLKWQSVHMRMLAYTSKRNKSNIHRDYLTSNYAPFFCTDDFQLWSMNNFDKKIKGTWTSYKWVCKDIIYDYTNDAEYRDTKSKIGSLYFLLLQQGQYNFIDSSFAFYDHIDTEDYYNAENDLAKDI